MSSRRTIRWYIPVQLAAIPSRIRRTISSAKTWTSSTDGAEPRKSEIATLPAMRSARSRISVTYAVPPPVFVPVKMVVIDSPARRAGLRDGTIPR